MFREIRSNLHTAAVGDLLDAIDFYHQFLPPDIQPLQNDIVVLGRALPVREEDPPDPES